MGLRRSASTTSTEEPVWAIATPRFAVIVVLPLFIVALVMSIVLIGLSTPANWMLVLKVRKASAIGEWGSVKR